MKQMVIPILAVVISVIGLGIGAWSLWFDQGETANTEVVAMSCQGKSGQTVPIHITATGFEPKDVTAQICDKLEFINETKTPRWPAAGPHPDHTSYPEFDAGRPLGKGKTFSLQLTRTGTFEFHDHQHEEDMGTLTITE